MSSSLRFVIRASIPLGLALAAGCATLHGPAQRGEASVVAERVSEGADIEARDGGGNTPLHLAARYARESVVEVLLAAGADARARNDQGATPLHYWGLGRHSDTTVASALLAAGADVDAQARGGNTPLHWAAARGAPAARSSRSSSGAMDSLERTARIPVVGGAAAVAAAPIVGLITLLEAFSSRPQPVENTTVLVDSGARVDSRNSLGNTPLHWAALSDAPADVVTALLSAGADGAARNAAGALPVDLVPDDSVLWSRLVSFRTTRSSGGSTPAAVRNLRVTRSTEPASPELDAARRMRWTWKWTWDEPASDGGHPITHYLYDAEPCGRSSRNADTFPMTRARSAEQSFTIIDETTGFEFESWRSPSPFIGDIEKDDAVDVASLWAVNARGAGRCVQVNIVDR
jgi:ankyrin repeat protein